MSFFFLLKALLPYCIVPAWQNKGEKADLLVHTTTYRSPTPPAVSLRSPATATQQGEHGERSDAWGHSDLLSAGQVGRPDLTTLGGHYWMGTRTDMRDGRLCTPCITLPLCCSPFPGDRPPHRSAATQGAELCLRPALPGFAHSCRDPAFLSCDTGDNTCRLSSEALKSSCSKVLILKCKLLFL